MGFCFMFWPPPLLKISKFTKTFYIGLEYSWYVLNNYLFMNEEYLHTCTISYNCIINNGQTFVIMIVMCGIQVGFT